MTDRRHDPGGSFLLFLGSALVRVKSACAEPEQCGLVGHHTNDGEAAPEPAVDIDRTNAGCDRDDQRPRLLNGLGDTLTCPAHDLRFDGEYEGGCAARNVIVRFLDDHSGKIPGKHRPLLYRGFGDEQVLRRVPALDESCGDRSRHVAAADESYEIVAHVHSRSKWIRCLAGRIRPCRS